MGEASAPASSANLGPGFDVLALALELRCRVSATLADTWSVTHGDGQRPHEDSDDAVLAGAKAAIGGSVPLALSVHNDIPIGRGLGSSAAALTAGAAAAWAAMDQGVDTRRLFELVAGIEGHSDNAAAAVFGGLVLVTPDGGPFRLPLHPGIKPVAAIPASVFLTVEARKVVPDSLDREVALRSIARMAALVGGFLTGDPALFQAAHGDEIHEAPRARMRPETAELVQVARSAGALHAAWSGSGPSVVALVDSGSEERVCRELSKAGAQVMALEVASSGVSVGLT